MLKPSQCLILCVHTCTRIECVAYYGHACRILMLATDVVCIDVDGHDVITKHSEMVATCIMTSYDIIAPAISITTLNNNIIIMIKYCYSHVLKLIVHDVY